jgi:hypothetical protein
MKRLQKTDFINKLLASTVGADVDTTNFPVWEVVATSSVPLRGKDGTIFESAVISPNTLFELAAYVNRDPLPLVMDHDMSGHPKGKFFYGQVMPNEFGFQELRGFKYVDPTESDTVAKIDNGTVDEVSIAFASREMKCSKCGWDYATAVAEDNLMPLLTRTCENGHTIGQDGTHLELEGVRDALELSLVSRGAAKNSKIIGQSDSKLSKQVERLAAHGLSLSDIYVTASASKGIDDMDMKDLIIELSDAKAGKATAEKDVERLERELAAERGKRNEADAKANDLERELADARAAAQAAPAEETEAVKQEREQNARDAKASVDFLTKQYTAVMAAAGKTDATPPTTAEDLIAKITEIQPELSAIIPTDGVTVAANSGGEKSDKEDYTMYRSFNRNRSR